MFNFKANIYDDATYTEFLIEHYKALTILEGLMPTGDEQNKESNYDITAEEVASEEATPRVESESNGNSYYISINQQGKQRRLYIIAFDDTRTAARKRGIVNCSSRFY